MQEPQMRDNTCIADLPEPITQININYLPEFDIMDYDLSDPKDTKKYFEAPESFFAGVNDEFLRQMGHIIGEKNLIVK